MIPALLPIAIVLAVVLLLWWQRRRRRDEASAGSAGTDAGPPPPPTLARPAPPPLRPLLRRMYAAVMDTPALAEESPCPDEAQAHVLAAAGDVLDRLDVRPQQMPRRPHLLPQLMRAVNDPNASGRDIAAIIARDPALAANLLRIANSALYRPQGQPLENLERAVVQVGTEGVRQIVATALMQPVLDLDGYLFDRLPAAVWDFALRSAAATAGYARRRRGDALSAQLVGLLHGLGAVVAMRVLRDEYASRPGIEPDLGVAAALVDRYTAVTARTIAIGWKMPPALAAALDEQRPERDAVAPATPLGTALRYGRMAAALAILVRTGAETEEHALAQLAALEPDVDANARLWKRLVAPNIE
ncbi:HDOD domain-containing protein [[Pseudomonas] boreopolis]|uniref:HDOD domain-containing protein n=1 Tax=Xanthomonas boreopolis TaxID=86183 RepID=UPI003D9FBBA7